MGTLDDLFNAIFNAKKKAGDSSPVVVHAPTATDTLAKTQGGQTDDASETIKELESEGK